jgi:23S rRNA (cytosine1962-C5)-methyltransferase
MNYSILTTAQERDYELLDSGYGEKLERFGTVIVARPDPQALWEKKRPQSEWQKADAYFTNAWKFNKEIAKQWEISFASLKFLIKPSTFKHVGIFPEQKSNWQWVQDILKQQKTTRPKVLNLFGYTGGATLAAAQAGAEVVHVDGSKTALTWARENAELSKLADKPIRWILDDVREFVRREIRRGEKYDGIIMDPPAFGRGPKGTVWKIEHDFLSLLHDAKQLFSTQPLFFLINGYASGYSALAYKNILNTLLTWPGQTEVGELTIEEKSGQRLLPAGIFARWNSTS